MVTPSLRGSGPSLPSLRGPDPFPPRPCHGPVSFAAPPGQLLGRVFLCGIKAGWFASGTKSGIFRAGPFPVAITDPLLRFVRFRPVVGRFTTSVACLRRNGVCCPLLKGRVLQWSF